MVLDTVKEAVGEPRDPEPPIWRRRSWIVVAVVLGAQCLVVVLDDAVPVLVIGLLLAVITAGVLRFRHLQPVATVAVVFGIAPVATGVAQLAGSDGSFMTSAAPAVFVAAWALCRWASGREIVVGAAIIIVMSTGFAIVGQGSDDPSDPFFGVDVVFWLLLGAVALVVRHRANSRRRAVADARMAEREQIARELHDTVAHHVSAIAIQAQAGQAVADVDPLAVAGVLRTIEESASRTLADMRRMVGILRQTSGDAGLVPQAGIADIEALGNTSGQPSVGVEIRGSFDDVGSVVGASLFRIAQESVTNARRHAAHATHISVQLENRDDDVVLVVIDDGDPVGVVPASASGFGLVGIGERVTALGGTLESGPGEVRGWVNRATIPRTGGIL